MVKKLVYKREIQEIREKMTPEQLLDDRDEEVINKEKVNVQCLMDIYQWSSDVHQDSVNKYEMIYQMNKRNIISSDHTDEHKVIVKEQFYKDYFHKVAEERELSEISGFYVIKDRLCLLQTRPSCLPVSTYLFQNSFLQQRSLRKWQKSG